jgi:hypothetical protein
MPTLTSFSQVRFWDIATNEMAVRFSGFDDRGSEFWMKEPMTRAGESRRKQRERVMALIQEAIEAGLEPGEVVVDE